MRVPLALSLSLFLAMGALLGGCGPDCQSSCEKIFGDGPEECAIPIIGNSAQEMTRDCAAHCEQALQRNGDVGTYKPNDHTSGNDEVSLENEKQAALWMDCIELTNCDFLNSGYCAPVKNFPAN